MTVQRTRAGQIHIAWLAFSASVVVLTVLVGLLAWDLKGRTPAGKEALVVYCAAGLKTPVEEVARGYEAAYGVPVRLQYGGSQTLLAGLEVSRRGDLYVTADESYVRKARDKGLVDETIPLARMTPVLAVRTGNPRGLHSLDDLLRGGVRIAQANPDAAAVGGLTREALTPGGRWQRLAERTTVFKPTVNDVANDLQVGAVDAGIIWDATVRQTPGLEMVCLPELEGKKARVFVAVVRDTTQPAAALRFARYLSAGDRGLDAFGRAGFEPEEGDRWSETPEVRFFGGAMLRPAVEETIAAFEQREGVRVQRVYNGCGILVSQMRAGARPDMYFSCDRSFMTQVADLFQEPVDVSTNQLAILVPRGNPRQIRSLRDLGRPGLRVGVGHEKQCALGALTQRTLVVGGQYEAVARNVVVQTPTGDMLVNQLRTGALDAVIAYVSNAAGSADEIDVVKIEGIPCALAVQPLAIGKDSTCKQLASRLRDALESRESRERFEGRGFQWGAP